MTSTKLLLALAIVAAFSFAQPVNANRKADAGPSFDPVSVPDTGSTVCLLSFALLGVAVLRRKLSR
jgi:VPDSG-CTERM motif